MSFDEGENKSLESAESSFMEFLEEAHNADIPELAKEPPPAPEREYTATEKEALAKGWKPDGYKSAEWFLEDESKYEELKARGKQIKALEKKAAYLEKTAYEKALRDLKEQRREAIELGDPDLVEDFDAKLEVVKQEMSQFNVEDEDDDAPDALAKRFLKKHENWLNSKDPGDIKMKVHAFELEEKLTKLNVPAADRLAYIEADLKDKFPDRFGEKPRAVQAVEAPTHAADKPANGAKAVADLNPAELMCYRYKLSNQGKEAANKYLKDLAKGGN